MHEQNCSVFACNLKAISTAERPRYSELVKRVRAAMQRRQETPNGYSFHLNGHLLSLQEVAEWISMERLCCPFLTLQLSASGTHTTWLLSLSGPEGIKALLDAEFPTHH